MKIDSDFRVGVPIEEAWDLLTDIPGIAPCLPGAQLTGQDGDNYEGKIKIKVGPVTAEYKGSATITEMDRENHRVLLDAKGRDSRGAGNASAAITALMKEDGDGTKVEISTDLKVSGKVAQFGRGVMGDVSKKLLGQFADCIEHKLATPESDAAAVASAGADTATEAAAAGAGAASAGTDAVKDAASGAANKVADAAGGATGAAAGAASGAAGAVSGAADAASGAVGGVADAATGAAGDAVSGAKDLVGGAAGAGKGAAVAGAAGAAAAVGGAAAAAKGMIPGGGDDDDVEALDLLDIAGGSVAKRLIPALVVLAIIVVILIIIFS